MNNGTASAAELADDSRQTGDAFERGQAPLAAPTDVIGLNCELITPEMLSLVELDQRQIDDIVQTVPGGAKNVQNIYPLSPLQEGMLFHHLLNEQSDTYVLLTLLELQSHSQADALIDALQIVIDRHEILRGAVLWEKLRRPVQVIYRQATLPVERLVLDVDRDPIEQIKELMRPERQVWNLRRAPLMRLQVVADARGTRRYALLQLHHLISDHESWDVVVAEAIACLRGREHELPEPVAYRHYVAWTLAHAKTDDAETFFRTKLGEVEEPTAPFGLLDVHGDGSQLEEAREVIEPASAQRISLQARRFGVSAARLFHAAWGLVVARASGRDDIVYGTVLLAAERKKARAQRMFGLFVNALPLRLQLQGVTVKELVEQTDRELKELVNYQQTPLTLAQGCSGNTGTAPLFSAVLNYRYSVGHSVVDPKTAAASDVGIRVLMHQYRTNYPVGLTVDNLGDRFALIAQSDRRIDPRRIIGYMQTAIQSLVEALERAPQTPALALSILPESERHQVITSFNASQAFYPREKLIHELFEEQVERTPDAIAVMHEARAITYDRLNRKANQLARRLRYMGVGSDQLVALFVERSVELLVGLLGVLKAGGAYLPLDPTNPVERLKYVLADAAPKVVLTNETLKTALPGTTSEVIALDSDWKGIARQQDGNLDPPHLLRRSPRSLAYVIYTSGSTGKPKGVMVEHRSIVNYAVHALRQFDVVSGNGSLICTSVSFDLMLTGLYPTLLCGRTVRLCSEEHGVPALADEVVRSSNLAPLKLTPSHLALLEDALRSGQLADRVRVLVLGGEPLHASAVQLWRKYASGTRIFNHYGPTETTVGCLVNEIGEYVSGAVPIGRPISNTQIFILDSRMQPLPIGVAGEIYISGAGVARGYLNHPELTAERFMPDPFSSDPQARLYKTGDLGRWRTDGAVEYVGRNDHQVKIRGYRIELGEIEAQLARHAQVKETVVLAREDTPGDRRLVAYVVGKRSAAPGAAGTPEKQRHEVVSEWETVHEETYRTNPILGPSFVGWNSSYTGQLIPEPQMQEWLSCTIARIRSLQPKRVLEIGCGIGLVLQNIAPHCAVYVGTDFAGSALSQLRQWASRQQNLKHVELLQRSATELQDIQDKSFDTVVLNSVVQYFPDVDYLLAVLQEAVRLIGPGGRIFIGDVRDLGLLSMFHGAVQLSKAAATVTAGQLRKRITRAVTQDKELVIDPQFFKVLPGRLPGISAVEVLLKRGRAPNELTRYRYDVVLHTGETIDARVVCEPLEWRTAIRSVAELEAALVQRRWCAARLSSIPNGRLAREAAVQRLIEASDETLGAGALRRQLNELPINDDADPETFWELGQAHDYDVQVSPGVQGYFDVQLLDLRRADQVSRAALQLPEATKPWGTYVNDPLENGFRQQLVLQLREHLKARLPEYMVPSAWIVLKQLPLTPNGKVDRRALPDPQGRPEDIGEYVAPCTELERTLTDIWAQVLQVDQVGVHDDFFELGGHSILAMQVVARIRSSLSMEMPMRLLFECPTVRRLSAQMDELRQVTPLDSILDDIDGSGERMEELRARVAAMPESQVQELMRKLRASARP